MYLLYYVENEVSWGEIDRQTDVDSDEKNTDLKLVPVSLSTGLPVVTFKIFTIEIKTIILNRSVDNCDKPIKYYNNYISL